jgi:hypothetical protein
MEFFIEYWLPEYPFHIIKQGIVKFQVKGKDSTPPVIDRIQVTGDNVLQAKIYDGSKIDQVKITLTGEKDTKQILHANLTDDGQGGDRSASDLVFSFKIPSQVFGIFRAKIEAHDAFGNKTIEESEEKFVVH